MSTSEERERLLHASENWRDFIRNIHVGNNEWQHSDERRMLADLLSIETMLRTDRESIAASQRENEQLRKYVEAADVVNKHLGSQLGHIAYNLSLSVPTGADECSHYRGQLMEAIGTAARALNPTAAEKAHE